MRSLQAAETGERVLAAEPPLSLPGDSLEGGACAVHHGELPVLTGLARDESVGDGGDHDGVLVELLVVDVEVGGATVLSNSPALAGRSRPLCPATSSGGL